MKARKISKYCVQYENGIYLAVNYVGGRKVYTVASGKNIICYTSNREKAIEIATGGKNEAMRPIQNRRYRRQGY